MKVIIINKKILISVVIITIVLIIISMFMVYKYKRAVKTSALPTLEKVIIIDPGHGGVDGGAVGKTTGVYESEVNLDIALKLKKYLEESGSLVLMTREKDVGLYTQDGSIRKKKNEDLRNRKELFDESRADAVISIHLNSFPQSQYYGAQTFYPKKSEKSKLLAELIQEELIRVIDNGNNRKAKVKNNVYILKDCKTTTVLVECGFLSNPKEEVMLQDSTYQDKIAWSIYVGVLRYFNKINI